MPWRCGSPSLVYLAFLSLILTFACAQVVLVLATARRTVLLAGLEVRELSRRAHGRPAL